MLHTYKAPIFFESLLKNFFNKAPKIEQLASGNCDKLFAYRPILRNSLIFPAFSYFSHINCSNSLLNCQKITCLTIFCCQLRRRSWFHNHENQLLASAHNWSPTEQVNYNLLRETRCETRCGSREATLIYRTLINAKLLEKISVYTTSLILYRNVLCPA
jgi:hypothetical protein